MKKNIKKALLLLLALTVVFAFSSCGKSSSTSSKVYNLRCGTHYNTSHSGYKELKACVDEISKKTDGKVKIKLYPSSQLGDYTNMYEQLKTGDLDMAMISIPSEDDPKIEMNFVPYLVSDYSELNKALGPDSYFFKEYEKVHEKQHVHLMGIYVEGMIGFGMTKLPSNYANPAVKKGLKVRAPAIEVYSLVTRDLGYSSTTINYSDLYSSLQTGVCDGWIGGTPQLNYSDFKDVIKYYIPYNTFAENGGYFMSDKTWNKLPEKYQKIIQECVDEHVQNSFTNAKKLDNEYLQKMKDYGIKIMPLTDSQLAACKAQVRKDVWPKLEKKIGKTTLDKLTDSVK